MRIYLEDDEYTTTTREADTDDSWDRGSTATTHDFGGAFLGEKVRSWGEYIEVADGEFEEGDTVHLVVAVYSTGDSFGNDDGACVEMISAHKEESNAIVAEGLVTHATGPVDLPDGYKLTYLPWKGYFESLDYVTIVTRVLK